MSIIRKHVSIDYQYFDCNYLSHIEDKLKSVILNTCSRELGYIKDILGVKYVSNRVSKADCSVVFTVDVTIRTLKPEIDAVFTADVLLVTAQILMTRIDDTFDLIIPPYNLKKYTFYPEKNYYYLTNSKHRKSHPTKIKLGDKIDVQVTKIKFERNRFCCIGNLKID